MHSGAVRVHEARFSDVSEFYVYFGHEGLFGMNITSTIKPSDRAAWREWLEVHHGTEKEVWLLLDDRAGEQELSYLDAVEEALCFGWIDGIQKRFTRFEQAQRFTPRRGRSNWTELNKERSRRLIRLGLMTEAGRAVLPDLDAPFSVPEDIAEAFRVEPGAWSNFLAFPELYRRVRIRYVEETRKNPAEFSRRLKSLLKRSSENRMFGNWNDGGRLA